MFGSTVGKSKFSYALPEMSYFYGLKKTGTFSIPNNFFFRNSGKELVKTHKTDTVPGKPGRLGSLFFYVRIFTALFSPLRMVFWMFFPVFEGHTIARCEVDSFSQRNCRLAQYRPFIIASRSSLILSGVQQIVTSTVILRGLRTSRM